MFKFNSYARFFFVVTFFFIAATLFLFKPWDILFAPDIDARFKTTKIAHIEAESILLNSPDSDYIVLMMALEGGAGIWITKPNAPGEDEYPAVGLYVNESGAVVGVFDHSEGGNELGLLSSGGKDKHVEFHYIEGPNGKPVNLLDFFPKRGRRGDSGESGDNVGSVDDREI